MNEFVVIISNIVCNSKGVVTGRVAQTATCLAADVSLTADPGVACSIPPGPILSWRLTMKY